MLIFYIFLAVLISLLQSCTSENAIIHHTKLNYNQALSHTAAMNSILLLDNLDKRLFLCAQPSPDAEVSSSSAFSFDLSLVNYRSPKGQDSVSDSSNSTELQGRTPALLLARELFYRQCELNHNYKVKYSDALKFHSKILDIIKELALKEAEHTSITISEIEQIMSSPLFSGIMQSGKTTKKSKTTSENSTVSNDGIDDSGLTDDQLDDALSDDLLDSF